MTEYDIVICRHDSGEEVARITFNAESDTDEMSDDAYLKVATRRFAEYVGEVVTAPQG